MSIGSEAGTKHTATPTLHPGSGSVGTGLLIIKSENQRVSNIAKTKRIGRLNIRASGSAQSMTDNQYEIP